MEKQVTTMLPALMAVGAMSLYGLQNVLMEQKFKGTNTLSLMVVMYSVVLSLSLVTGTIRGPVGNPVGSNLLFGVIAGTILFGGNYLMTGAYTNGGSSFTVTMIMVATPVMASVAKYLWVGGLPTGQQLIGYLLAAFSIYLVITGRPKPA